MITSGCMTLQDYWMADRDAIIRLDEGGINARILAKEAKVDFRRVESASRKIQTTFCSPEVKRLFVRYFNGAQLNSYVISVIARTKLPHAMVEKVEIALKAQLDELHAEVNETIDSAEALCEIHGITQLATYDTEPLKLEVKVISPFGRRYLELMTKVDRLMPMLETLAIDEVIEVTRLDLQKAQAKKFIRKVAGTSRNFAAGLRQRMNAMADTGATRDSTKLEEKKASEGSLPPTHVAASMASDPSMDSPTVDAAATMPPGTTKISASIRSDVELQANPTA